MQPNLPSAHDLAEPAYATDYNGVDQADDLLATGSAFNLDAIRGMIWRQRYVLAAIVAAALVLGFIVTLLTVPTYQATATLKVESSQTEIVPGQDIQNLAGRGGRSFRGTFAEILKSRSMSGRVVDKLKLGNRLGAKLGEKPAGMSAKDWEERKREAAISLLPGGLTVGASDMSDIISISYSSPDRQLAAAIANAYTDAFLQDDLDRTFAKSEYARSYLTEQIQKIQAKLNNAEQQSINFARAARIVSSSLIASGAGSAATASPDQDSAAPSTIVGSNLAAVNSAYTTARTARITAEQRWKTVAGMRPGDLPEVQNNPSYQQLLTTRANIAADLANQRARYGDDYPQTREMRARITTIDQQIQVLGAQIKDGLKAAYQSALQQENAFSDEVGKVSDETLNEQSRRVQFGQLEREASAYRKQLDAMLTRYNELSATANIEPSSITKLDDARTPGRPVSPNMMVNLLIATILGIAVAVAVALMRELFDDRLRSIQDLESKLGIRALGITPMSSRTEDLAEDPGLLEAYSAILTSMSFCLPSRSHNIVSFTSSQSAEGKSTTAFAIARRMAALGNRVLIIDGDLRRSSLATQAGHARPAVGLTDVLLGTATFESALLPHEQEGLDILPNSSTPAQPVEVLSSQRLAQFLEEQRPKYSLIILDSPPVIGLADAPILAHLADATVFVVEANRAHHGQIKAALRRLRAANANVIGAVLSKFHSRMAGYGYDYTYYSYGEGKGKE